MSFGTNRATEPCRHYFGNVCTGFGGSATCMFCGWERHEHPPDEKERERIKALFRTGALPAGSVVEPDDSDIEEGSEFDGPICI